MRVRKRLDSFEQYFKEKYIPKLIRVKLANEEVMNLRDLLRKEMGYYPNEYWGYAIYPYFLTPGEILR